MNGLIPFTLLIVFGLATYFLYSAGIFDDLIIWTKDTWKKLTADIKVPKFDRNIITKKKEPVESVNDLSKFARKKESPSNSVGGSRSKRGMMLTNWELDYLWDGIAKRKRVPCFNCLSDDMYSGMQKTSGQDWHCPNCGQSINLTLLSGNRSGLVCMNLGIDNNKIKK